MIRVIVNGANGRMGTEIIQALGNNERISLVGKTGRKDDLAAVIRSTRVQVVIDFTHPSAVFQNIVTIVTAGANAVVGTSGLTEHQRMEIDRIAREHNRGVLIAPNFNIGAVLMMKFAAEAARYLPHVQIIEYHHDGKADAPSGTAIHTAEYISKEAGITLKPQVESREVLEAASLGAKIGNIRIHAVRLPGFIASQEVLLSENGQTLTIRHDTIDRQSYIPGILEGIKKIGGFTGLVYGLENIL